MKAYGVFRCKVDNPVAPWTGTVIAEDNQSVSSAICEKFGKHQLYCEKYLDMAVSTQIVHSEVPIETVNISDLTVGEVIKLIKYFKEKE